MLDNLQLLLRPESLRLVANENYDRAMRLRFVAVVVLVGWGNKGRADGPRSGRTEYI